MWPEGDGVGDAVECFDHGLALELFVRVGCVLGLLCCEAILKGCDSKESAVGSSGCEFHRFLIGEICEFELGIGCGVVFADFPRFKAGVVGGSHAHILDVFDFDECAFEPCGRVGIDAGEGFTCSVNCAVVTADTDEATHSLAVGTFVFAEKDLG